MTMSPAAHPSVRPEIRAFFARYAVAGDRKDADALRSCFLDVFLNLDPNGAAAVNVELLIETLPARDQLFSAAGASGMDLVSLTELPLDDCHTLVETTWSVRFTTQVRAEPLQLTAAFLLRRTGDTWRIAAYLNHHDVPGVLRLHAHAGTDPPRATTPRLREQR